MRYICERPSSILTSGSQEHFSAPRYLLLGLLLHALDILARL